ncbi:hypothetical protein [Francisella sp. 19X1-34]|uniref:hypothetical protein n=1 Tax=Francisella sp. 19X1-34 TaxID=3087177 RepID=UPI002E33F808|nr:hypothetical protein [Francisella sp. 19X1-34]MED7788112.1 hypothetical protein [Francisella sp. 19X1-34]
MLGNLSVGKINFDDLTDLKLEELKSQFNYNSPTTLVELEFAQQYNKWLASKQMDGIPNGRLQVSITTLNEDLSENIQKIKYLHTIQIKDLKLDFELYGFSGELSFNIPYDLEKESLWDDLSNYQNKFVIDIRYQEDLKNTGFSQPNRQNNWSIKGYIDLSKDNAIELIDQVSHIGARRYLSCKLLFTDALTFITKQHYPVKIYPQSRYADIFDDIFGKFDKLLSISINEDITAFYTQYNWICVNCDYPKYSFYDFFFYTLRHYQLQLIYDYSTQDPNYSIVDLSKPETKEEAITELPMGIISRIVNQIGDYSFSNSSLINQHWALQEESPIKSVHASSKSIPASKDHIFSYAVPSIQLENAEEFYKKEIDNTKKKLKYIDLEWEYFPAEFTILPRSKFSLPKTYKKILSQYTGALVISSTKISFRNYNNIAIYAGQTSIYTTCASNKDISSIDYQLKHGIDINTCVCSADVLALSFPNFAKPVKALNIYGWIDGQPSGTDTTYSIVAADQKDSQKDINKDFSTEKTIFLMHDHTLKELSYIVRIPSLLNGNSNKSLYITLPYFILHDHAVMPLRNGTPVAISLSQENGSIDKVMWHSMLDESFNKNSQINKMTLGANDSAGIVHQAENKKLQESALEIFSQTSNNKTQIISDKTQMSLIYREE